MSYKNKYLTESFFIIISKYEHTLVSFGDTEAECIFEAYYEALDLSDIDISARFATKKDANVAINYMKSLGCEIDSTVIKYNHGSLFYESIRESLKGAYGNTLWEGNTDHIMTEAALDAVYNYTKLHSFPTL